MNWFSFQFDRRRDLECFKRDLQRQFSRQHVLFFIDGDTVRAQREPRASQEGCGFFQSRMQFANFKAKLNWFEKGWRAGKGLP